MLDSCRTHLPPNTAFSGVNLCIQGIQVCSIHQGNRSLYLSEFGETQMALVFTSFSNAAMC